MKIKILDQTWSVEKVYSHDARLLVDGDVCSGTCWNGKHEICLSVELNENTAERVIRHELAHAYLFATQACTAESYNEEQLCDFIAIYGDMIVGQAQYLMGKLFAETHTSPDGLKIGGFTIPADGGESK